MTTKVKTYRCVLCDKYQTAERMVYSTHTQARYCAAIDACDKRRRRQAHA